MHSTIRCNSYKTFRRLALATAVSGLLAGTSSAYAAAATGTSTADIITAISIANNIDLAFGAIVPDSGAAGTVAMGTDGTVSCTTVTCVTQSTTTAGSFTVSGEDGYTYGITLPADGNVTLSNGAETMTVNSFISTPSGTGTLTSGSETLKVGATLDVGAAQASGSYTGTYDVTVEYN